MHVISGPSALGEMLARMAGGSDDDDAKVPVDPEAQIMELRQMGEIYAASIKECPFKVGDLITPRPNVGIKGPGYPHLVVEVRPDAMPRFDDDSDGKSGNGRRLDIRLLCYAAGRTDIVPFWGESWTYQKYEPSK